MRCRIGAFASSQNLCLGQSNRTISVHHRDRAGGKIFALSFVDQVRALERLPLKTQGSMTAASPENFSVEPHGERFDWTRLAGSAIPSELLAKLPKTS
jgi:hypothetical protein